MKARQPVVAGMFYPADPAQCLREVQAYLKAASVDVRGVIRGGIVPHAGWTFSGATAARVFEAIATQSPPETLVCFGAVHSWGVSVPSMYGRGSWRTPIGELEVDQELARAVLSESDGQVVDRPEAHQGEHSIEVQLPFIKALFPEARILPIAVPPSSVASQVGIAVARAAEHLGRAVVAIGSSDLTHYGPRYGFAPVGVGPRGLEWAKENDRHLLELVVQMEAEQVVPEAQRHHNACGSGAIAAAIAFSAALGATRGIVLQHITSHEVMPMGRPTDLVGYAAVVFVE